MGFGDSPSLGNLWLVVSGSTKSKLVLMGPLSDIKLILLQKCFTQEYTLHEPHTYREASIDPLWQIAMKEELNALFKNHTWDLVTFPPRKSVIGCKWTYKIKTRF